MHRLPTWKSFFSRKKYQSLIFAWKMGLKYLMYKIITKMRLLGFWAEKSHWCIMEVSLAFLPYFLHNDGKSGKVTPAHGHLLPVKRASVARKWGNECPYYGQWMPKLRACFWAIFFWYFMMFKRSFCDVKTSFLRYLNWFFSCIVLSLMILLWHFMILLWYFFLLFTRSLIDCKYRYISNIIWIF